jgi:hypothetical protein
VKTKSNETVKEISFNKETLSLIKDLTVICNSIVISKQGDNITISQSNNSQSLGYILTCNKDNFNFDGEKIAFYDFREFYQLLDVFQNPMLKQDGRFIKMTDSTTKINYLLTDEETIQSGPEELDFGDVDSSVAIEASTIIEIRRMLSACFSQSNPGVDVKCKVSAKKDKIIMTFQKEEFDNSFERTFECENEKEFEFVLSADMFTDVPKGNYTIDFYSIGMARMTLKNENIKVEIFTGEAS